eukprot:TRINITY_DN27626_c0_g1_i1.p1 TRINITY_DN27626_c0_g1~~TRINITY_DN27626_c0_g1_i1.p1  ORF type:complete len:307 (+),score=67.87 TRINITY_DN27626_c0_g1_i1:332-1252(+)
MELLVETADGSALPPGCYVGVRVGDILKQGRYEPQRSYLFPKIERRRNARIDLYQHVGCCTVAVDPDTKSVSEVDVASTDPGLPPIKLKVNVTSKTEVVTKQREIRSKALKNQAKDYLNKHGVEARLAEAVKALLKEQPDDPTDFLCRHLRGDYIEDRPTKPAQGRVTVPPPPVKAKPQGGSSGAGGGRTEPAALEPFRAYCREHINKRMPAEAFEGFYSKFPGRAGAAAKSRCIAEDNCLEAAKKRVVEKLKESCASGRLEEALAKRLPRRDADRPRSGLIIHTSVLRGANFNLSTGLPGGLTLL